MLKQMVKLCGVSAVSCVEANEEIVRSVCCELVSCVADLPTCPYLTVLVQKSAGSTDVCMYFSKYGQRASRKYRNCNMNDCEFVVSEVDH